MNGQVKNYVDTYIGQNTLLGAFVESLDDNQKAILGLLIASGYLNGLETNLSDEVLMEIAHKIRSVVLVQQVETLFTGD